MAVNVNNQTSTKKVNSNLGKRLHKALGGGTYKEITEYLNKIGMEVDYETIRRYILGHRKPDAEMLTKFAIHAGINIHWLLTGVNGPHVHNEEIDGFINPIGIWENSAWSHFELEEIKALEKMAKKQRTSVKEIVHKFTRLGLTIQGLLDKPVELVSLSLKNTPADQLISIELRGEIGDSCSLTQIKEEIKIPRALIPEEYKDGRHKIHPNAFHAFRLITNVYSDEQLYAGDVIVSGIMALYPGWLRDHEISQPVLIKREEGTRVLYRRIYRDSVQAGGEPFIFRPVHKSEPIEIIPNVRLSELEFIHGIVTS